jgi:hypothetical protein
VDLLAGGMLGLNLIVDERVADHAIVIPNPAKVVRPASVDISVVMRTSLNGRSFPLHLALGIWVCGGILTSHQPELYQA